MVLNLTTWSLDKIWPQAMAFHGFVHFYCENFGRLIAPLCGSKKRKVTTTEPTESTEKVYLNAKGWHMTYEIVNFLLCVLCGLCGLCGGNLSLPISLKGQAQSGQVPRAHFAV